MLVSDAVTVAVGRIAALEDRCQALEQEVAQLAERNARLRNALLGEMGLLELIVNRPELSASRQVILGNYRHLEAREALMEPCVKCAAVGIHELDDYGEPLCVSCRESAAETAYQCQQEDGEAFRGGEAAAYEREQMDAARRLK